MNVMPPIALIGAGAWGTALGKVLAENGHVVHLWGNEPEVLQDILETACNNKYLKGVCLPKTLCCKRTLADALQDVREVLVVVPSHVFGLVLSQIHAINPDLEGLAWATKGVDPEGYLLHEVAQKIYDQKTSFAVLSGPTFAKEIARGSRAGIAVGASCADYGTLWQQRLVKTHLKVSCHNDIVGVQIGGALKNIYAIGVGLIDGLGWGANARAAFLTAAMQEMMQCAVKLDGQKETLMGLSGLGDLILTCTDDQSRNRRYGIALGQGQSPEQAQATVAAVVEGINTSNNVEMLAKRLNHPLPLCHALYKIIHEQKEPTQALEAVF